MRVSIRWYSLVRIVRLASPARLPFSKVERRLNSHRTVPSLYSGWHGRDPRAVEPAASARCHSSTYSSDVRLQRYVRFVATFEEAEIDGSASGDADDESSLVIAGVGRRVSAGFVDSLAISLGTYLVFRVADGSALPAPGWVAFVVAEFVLVVGPMAVTGRPLGALAARTVVIRSVDHGVPGWLTSIVRWLVAHLPILVVGAVVAIGVPDAAATWLGVLQLFVLAVIYGAMLFSPDVQGLHDRAAGTIVVLRDGDADTWLVRQKRVAALDPRQIAVEARKRELMALGPAKLMEFVPTTGYDSYPPELATSQDGFRLGVSICRDLGNDTDDVLFSVSPSDSRWPHRVYLESFAVRGGSEIDELTDEEWGYVT